MALRRTEDTEREIEMFLKEVNEADIDFFSFEKDWQKSEGFRTSLEATIESIKNRYESLQEALKTENEVLDESNVRIEDSPFENKVKVREEFTDQLVQERTYILLLQAIYFSLAFRFSRILHVARGSSLTAELLEKEQQYIKDYGKDLWEKFMDLRELDRKSQERQIDWLSTRMEERDKILESAISLMDDKLEIKLRNEIQQIYQKRIKELEGEKASLEDQIRKLDKDKKDYESERLKIEKEKGYLDKRTDEYEKKIARFTPEKLQKPIEEKLEEPEEELPEEEPVEENKEVEKVEFVAEGKAYSLEQIDIDKVKEMRYNGEKFQYLESKYFPTTLNTKRTIWLVVKAINRGEL